MKYTIQELKDKKLIIFEAIMGSKAYGTDTPESDTDIRGVFIQPLNDVLKYGFVDQISDEKSDIVYYELGRFIDLVSSNNPNILEMLKVPEDCVLSKHFVFKKIEENFNKFLTKRTKLTFGGYAIGQIKKARGYNKKMNWEEEKMTRKTVLDFCYIIEEEKSIPFLDYMNVYNKEHETNLTYENFGLSSINHAKDLYAMYKIPGAGIVKDPETANDVQLLSIPKNCIIRGYLFFNKDGYSSHCKKYAEYQIWLKERNPNRVRMNKDHGKNYDSKNMMHTYRLLMMATELANGELNVRRSPEEIEKLMKIRKGEYEYEDLLKEAENMISNLDDIYEKSSLPEEVDMEFVRDFLFQIRKFVYYV